MPRSKPRPLGLWLVGVAAPPSPSPGQRGASSEAPMPVNGRRSWDMGVSRVLPVQDPLLLALPIFPPLLLVLPFPPPPLPLPPKDHRPPLLLLLLPVV